MNPANVTTSSKADTYVMSTNRQEPTGFLEESPGVFSSTRLVLVMSMVIVLLFVITWLGLCVHANLHKPGIGLLSVPAEAIAALSAILGIPALLKQYQSKQENRSSV